MSSGSFSNYLSNKLAARAEQGKPVTVAIVGAGDYAIGLASQPARIPGARASVVCDLDLDAAAGCYAAAGISPEAVRAVHTRRELLDAVRSGAPAITEDSELVLDAGIEVVVDCTGEPDVGARLARGALESGSHVVMVNVEADATVGTELAELARRNERVYTLADGDQPSLIVELADWAVTLGFDLVAVGKWTDAYSPEEASQRLAARTDPRKSDVTFLDGSKAQIELASAANCLGLTVEPGGLTGPGLDLPEIAERLRVDGPEPLLTRKGVCEYIDCRKLDPSRHTFFGGGVFVCASSDAKDAMQVMARKGVTVSRDATHAVFYRPYHLVGAETPWSILTAALEGRPTAQPALRRTVEVVAEAKRDIAAGERLRGLGSDDVCGRAVTIEAAANDRLLPFGLAAGCTMCEGVKRGMRLTVDMVDPPEESAGWKLRREADSLSEPRA